MASSVHNRVLNDLNQVFESNDNRFFKTSKLVGINLLTVGTGTAVAFSLLGEMCLAGGIGLTRVVTWSDFAANRYKNLPKPAQWVETLGKVAVLYLGRYIALLAAMGSLVIHQASTWNLSYNGYFGFYKNVKEEAKKAAVEKEAAEKANKLPTIGEIQIQAKAANNEVIRIEKKIAECKKRAEMAVSLDEGVSAFEEAVKDCTTATKQFLVVVSCAEQAVIKLKANQIDCDSAGAMIRLSEEACQTIARADIVIKQIQNLVKIKAIIEQAENTKRSTSLLIPSICLNAINVQDALNTVRADSTTLRDQRTRAEAAVREAQETLNSMQNSANLFITWLEEPLLKQKPGSDSSKIAILASKQAVDRDVTSVKNLIELMRQRFSEIRTLWNAKFGVVKRKSGQ